MTKKVTAFNLLIYYFFFLNKKKEILPQTLAKTAKNEFGKETIVTVNVVDLKEGE